MAIKELKSIKFPGLEDTYVIPEGVQIDGTLSVSGKAADAKSVGDALEAKQPKGDYALKSEIPSTSGLATEGYVNEQISKIPTPDVSGQIGEHNISNEAHNDIRVLINELKTRLNTLADSDDTTLDQMSEIVAYIKSNKSLIDGITTNKINVSDIINNLTTNVSNKPLSAAQGVAIKALIDNIVVPTKVSQLTNDSGFLSAIPSEYITESELLGKKYLTSYTETDPTVPAWAKKDSKPSYTKSEIGLGNVDNVKQYSAENPPPYPVTSVNGKTGAVTIDAVPTSRTVNGKALSSNITLSASDVGAAASSHGTHVTYSTTAPVMDGTASVGSASTVARSDHKHPTDTSRASKSEFDSHNTDTTKHITSTERTNWNAAKSHADSAHAPSNAEPNQNAFSNITVGSTTIAADSKTDTLTLVAGSNVTLTPDASNDKITIAAKDTVYTHPSYTAKSSGLYKVTVDGTGHVSATSAVSKSDITGLGIPAQDTTYSAATTSANGLMTSAMVTKLNGIATGANKTTVDSALSSTSTNPVQNKIIKAALDKCGSVDIDLDDIDIGEATSINADTLGGVKADEYIKKSDAMAVTKNYSVVGGPNQPENPTENMIWVQTETEEIGKVYFSGIEPTNCANNDIWISTNNYSSTVAFDSIRIGNDTMQTIYPLSAKQYIDGALVDKTAKSYQDGKWVDWMPEGALYYRGDELTDITGGWGAADFGYTWAGTGDNINDIIKNSDSMTIKAISGVKVGLAGTKNKINFSGYSKLTMRYSANVTHENAILYLCSARTATSNDASVVAKIQYPSGDNKTITLNLEGVPSGSYYVLVASDGDVETTIYEIYPEK